MAKSTLILSARLHHLSVILLLNLLILLGIAATSATDAPWWLAAVNALVMLGLILLVERRRHRDLAQ